MEAMQKAEALEHTDECHWTLVLVKRVGATVAIFALLLTPCSTADAGRRCQWKMQRACNRAAIIQQGIPRMRAEAGLNRSRALLNFSKPFNIWG